MPRHSSNINLLEKINNISADCSEDGQEISDIEDNNADIDYDLFDSDNEDEEALDIRTGQQTKRLIVSSESDNEEEMETAIDGTVWRKIKEGSNCGRSRASNIFKERSGPTAYSKRSIMNGQVESAFSLIIIINRNTIEYIRKCTEIEAFSVLKTEWNLSTAKLYAFIGIYIHVAPMRLKI